MGIWFEEHTLIKNINSAKKENLEVNIYRSSMNIVKILDHEDHRYKRLTREAIKILKTFVLNSQETEKYTPKV